MLYYAVVAIAPLPPFYILTCFLFAMTADLLPLIIYCVVAFTLAYNAAISSGVMFILLFASVPYPFADVV